MLGCTLHDSICGNLIITQLDNCHNTRKVTCENVRKGEAMIPIIFADQLYFLDQYPIENFR